jgi:glucose-1-phosphate adenylyltransferase
VDHTPMMILAGGKGSRLAPLTCHRAKPAMPFAGRYRIIDFVLSNVVNSNYRRVYVLTQYMASSLIKHLNRTWHLSGIQEYIEVVPAQMRTGPSWYLGTADAVWQNVNLLQDARATDVGIFGGDHIYKFAIDQMQRAHRDSGAVLTIAGWRVPRSEASQFGVMVVDESGRLVAFQEKPANPTPIPGDPDTCLVSMGNYFFRTAELIEALAEDARDPDSAHDFGKNIIPALLRGGAKIQVYDFEDNRIRGEREGTRPYWRDVGTIESYFQANMEVRSSLPAVNLYNRQWRVRTAQRDFPPARMVRHGPEHPPAVALDSLVCEGAILSSCTLDQVLVGYDSYVRAGAQIEDAILMSGSDIGERARLRRVLLDKNCRIEPGAEIGMDPEADRLRFPFVSASGIVVLPKGTVVPRRGPIRFANDIADMLQRDPDAREALDAFAGVYEVADRSGHSYWSQGPRYRSAGPGDGEED